ERIVQKTTTSFNKQIANTVGEVAENAAEQIVETKLGQYADKMIESDTSSIGRMDLAGKTHPVSGVKFDSNGFPIFESKYNTKLDPQDYLKSRGTHFDRASKVLYNDIMNDSNLRSKFTEAEIAIKEGGVPKAYTWHHHQDKGVMQLVDRKIHRQTGHTGGFSIWGPGN
ncbi:MAG: HNH endonuclease, partial [Lachnospiraceae bacterium]